MDIFLGLFKGDSGNRVIFSAVFDGIIGKVGGTVTIDAAALAAGNVNGRINGVNYGTYLNPSFNFDYGAYTNLNDGAYMVSNGVITSSTKGPIAAEDLIPDTITWGEDNANSGTLNVYSNGSLWGSATKSASVSGTASITPVTPGSCINAGDNISIQWVADIAADPALPGSQTRTIAAGLLSPPPAPGAFIEPSIPSLEHPPSFIIA